MEIFQDEIDAGLGDVIAKASTIYEVEIEPNQVPENFKSVATNLNQADLYYMDTILVSTGWNKNTDVFSKEEVWAARKTPEDKKFNYEHKENDIIGHITGSFVVDDEWNVVKDGDELPDKLHIVTNAVLYRVWDDPDLQERMDKIIAEIPEGKWFVSMECFFRGFDYSLVDPDGKETVTARTKETAFLSKYLKAYGGTGEYNGQKIGRRLRNVTFSGKGLVRRPANPNSIIITEDARSSEIINENITENLENNMADDFKALLTEKETEIASLRQRLNELNERTVNEKIEGLKADILSRDNTIASLAEKLEAANKTVAEVNKKLADTEQAKAQVESKLADVEKAAKTEARVTVLVEAGKSKEDAKKLVDSFVALDDTAFTAVAAVIAEAAKTVASPAPLPEEDPAADNIEDLNKAEADENVQLNAEEEVADKALAEQLASYFE